MSTEETYIERLQRDPGDECFVDYADYLRMHQRFLEAMGVCVAGLSSNPAFKRGRLVLARIFFDAGFLPFAVREVEELLHQSPENPALKRLLEVMLQDKPSEEAGDEEASAGPPADDIVAEVDFDIEDIDGD